MPAIITGDDESPKTGSMGKVESKWMRSSSAEAENLMKSFGSDVNPGIKSIVKNILLNSNIPEDKIGKLKINFSSNGVEELGFDKDAVFFNDDFPVKYIGENMYFITKLFRAKNVVIDIVDEGSENFDPSVLDAISGGLRYGNKTETSQGNKMVIEILHMIYGYEYVPLKIERVSDYSMIMYLGEHKEVGMNSIKSVQTLEGVPFDFFVRFTSPLLEESLLVKVSNVNPSANFRLGNREGYTLTYIEKAGNKVTLSLSGFMISFE
ncbi:MAG: hypothetical protein L0Y79_09125 [Chlorobi bacterium]|nr:hypothetical protein [Chlorobiota bacterium]MCI0716966.1 hypothetical protein [Chlorobiota bacterium]